MKFKFVPVLFCLALTFLNVSAQLSGTYTIGGVTPAYATIPDAVTALQTQGVNGAVIMNIRPGVYQGKVDIANVNGASSVNTITFQSENGDSTSVIITDTASSTGSNYTFHIFGTDFLIIKKVTLSRPGTNANSTVISIGSNSRYLQIRNCVILSDVNTSTNVSRAQVFMPLGSPSDSGFIFANNIFTGGSLAINFQGQSAASPMPQMQIINNQFVNQSSRAVQLTYLASPIIRGNNISTITTGNTFRGINLRRVTGAFEITENKMSGSYGISIQLDTCGGTSVSRALIANNFLQSTGSSRGISVNFSSYSDFFNNSVNINSTSAASSAFYISDNGLSTFLNIKNNILVNIGGGTALRTGSLTSISACDYNDLFVAASSVLVTVDTINYAALSNWQTASSLDAHSISIDPEFSSVSDLHIFTASVNNLGTPISSVTIDIDNEIRSLTTPDIGADEFVPLNDNIGIISSFLPSGGDCGDSNMTVALIIRNYGLSSQTGFSVSANITGAVTQLLTDVFPGSILSNQVDTIILTSTINTYSGGTFTITSYTQLTGDQYQLNDTNVTSFTVNPIPNPPVVFSPQQICINDPQIVAAADIGNVNLWFDQASGGNILHIGDVFSPPLTTDTVFYVESRKASASSGCLRISEIQLRNPNFIEITNLSASVQDYTGWVVAVCGNGTNINTVNNTYWQLGVMNPGEVQYKTDDSNDNYWGTNIAFSTAGRGWAMIIDPNGVIADFVSINYPQDSLAVFNSIVASHPVTVGSEWSGNGINFCSVTTEDNQRIGGTDNNDASDWVCQTESKGTQNSNLSSPFIDCGIGACRSPRIPVNVILLPGLSLNLGNDTLVNIPFSITLDAGPGITSYLWSTAETSQTITVTTPGIYWVTVVDSLGICSFTDSISIQLNVGMNEKSTNDLFNFYPNPAAELLYISARGRSLMNTNIRVFDINGRLVDLIGISYVDEEKIIDISKLNEGIYLLWVESANESYIKRFTIIR